MGKTSLMVYWVHIVFVYGRLSILPKHKQGIPAATLGIAIIFVAMTLLSMARTRYDAQVTGVERWFKRKLRMVPG
jgi:hypothetical protein